jgi:putative ATPase
MSGVADLRKVYEQAKARRRTGQGTLLFIDEIHRFNRAQQDGLLAQVEDGTVTLIGATTENPSFALTGALLSRCQVLVLNRLDAGALEALIGRAEQAIGHPLPLADEARARLCELADGDGRYLLNMVENLADLPPAPLLDPPTLAHVLQRRMPLYDRQQEAHYNLISALHKSVRGSDPDATLYWLARMLAGGEDPRYIARRLVRMASEDIGLADPTALPLAIAASQAYEQLGSPEGELALAECAVHLACAPKSNALYRAFGEATAAARESGSLMPPAHILNAPTRLMRDLGYGRGYEYDHHAPDRFSGQDYFPEGMARPTFYRPTDQGAEAAIAERLERWAARRRERAQARPAAADGS